MLLTSTKYPLLLYCIHGCCRSSIIVTRAWRIPGVWEQHGILETSIELVYRVPPLLYAPVQCLGGVKSAPVAVVQTRPAMFELADDRVILAI